MRRAQRITTGLLLMAATGPLAGCSLAPKSFRALLHPAPIVRARAVGLDGKQPDAVAVPALIGRLDDPDPVVRMTANDTLKERTGQDFGFVPWANPEDRRGSADRWRSWWAAQPSASDPGSAQAAYPKDDALRKVAVQPGPRRRKRRRDGGQGGAPAWPVPPATPQPSTDPLAPP